MWWFMLYIAWQEDESFSQIDSTKKFHVVSDAALFLWASLFFLYLITAAIKHEEKSAALKMGKKWFIAILIEIKAEIVLKN